MTNKILLVQSSARNSVSTTRTLSKELAEALGGPVTERDVSAGFPVVTEDWIEARNAGEGAELALSEELISELETHDTIVIAVPVYNFSIPAALKSWIDLGARARRTFRYTEDGPVGLLTGKRAYIVMASGGTEMDGSNDFATPYMRYVLGFIGITDVEVVAADGQARGVDAAMARAREGIDALVSKDAA